MGNRSVQAAIGNVFGGFVIYQCPKCYQSSPGNTFGGTMSGGAQCPKCRQWFYP